MSYLRNMSCVALLAFTATLTTGQHTTPSPNPQSAIRNPQSPSASAAPEVRLRKLHLVRPDLIPYPIAFEVYC